MKYTLSKKLVNKIIEKEIQKTGIPVKVMPLTNLENIQHIIEKEKQETQKSNIITMKNLRNITENVLEFRNLAGDYDHDNNYIKILLSEIKRTSPTKFLYLWELLITTYHEYNHKLLFSKAIFQNELEKFSIQIERLPLKINYIYESNIHDDFYTEIIANVYSVEKASQFLQKYPNIYKELTGYIEEEKLHYQMDFINYDVEIFLNYITKIIQMMCPRYVKKLFSNSKSPFTILEVLYHKDGIIKDFKTLSKSKKWNSLDKEVKYTIASSKSCLNQLNEDYTKEELLFILEALNYSYQKEIRRSKENEILREKILKHNKIMLPSLDYGKNLIPSLNTKEKRNYLKIKYLEEQIQRINQLLIQKQSPKKKVRI